MNEDKSKTIIPKRATKTKLASSESVLKEGEIALIYPDTGPGTGAAKLVSGDGATVAKNLPIAIDGEAIDELKESLDIAKKIIPISLSLTGWKSANDNNSAPYVQTVINEELKSSMNPDLVSMLDESATPEEQEVYNKNLAIISQGVGTVNNGSITYKVYKLPSADITIGLTRLGGVKEVETASGVDDVKVGGVSVVENKIAKIPAIPKSNVIINRIPLSGIQGNSTFSTNAERGLYLVISANTPLSVDKYIGSTLLVVPNREAEPHIIAWFEPISITLTTESSNSETLVTSLSVSFKAMAMSITETDPDGTNMEKLNTASVSLIIVTDGVVVSLDKEKSRLVRNA